MTNSSQADTDLSDPSSQVATISSLKVFKLEAPSTDTNNGGKRRRLLASVSSQQSRLTRVSNGVKVDGLLETGRATLQLEFTKQVDCLAEFVCQVRGVDTEGRALVSTSHILQQPGGSNDQRVGLSHTPGSVMQVLSLMQQLDSKLAVVGSAVGSWEDDMRRMKDNIDYKTDRLEDKIQSLGKEFDAQTDRLEDKIESILTNLNKETGHQQRATCTDSEDLGSLIRARLDPLESSIQEKFHEMSLNLNATASETRSILDAQFAQGNLTFEAGLKSTLTNLLKPKDCYKGMGPRVSLVSSQYTVIEPSQENSLVAPVLCDTFTDGGGWIVFQRRVTGDVKFYRGWDECKQGFGSLDGDFWLGLDNIHAITNTGVFELRIDMIYNGNFAFAHYDSFSVGNENSNYVLHVAHYDGTAGDSLNRHNGMKFTTHDRDNDVWTKNCAVRFGGPWWYKDCVDADLNGEWGSGSDRGPRWAKLSGDKDLSFTEMKVRRVI